MKLHIAFAAPIATEHVAHLLRDGGAGLPPGYGGAPFTGVLIGELLRQGHRVSAFTTDHSMYGAAETVHAAGENFDFYLCAERPRAWRPNDRRLGRAVDAFGYEIGLLARTMAESRPDIVHAHWSYEFALAALRLPTPHLITCHDAPGVVLRFNPYPFRAVRYLMARRVFGRGRHFSTVSAYMREQLRGLTRRAMHVVPNPLADYVLASGRAGRPLPATRRIAMAANGWDARKNAQAGLAAFAEFRRQAPHAELHVFGQAFGPGQAAEQWCIQNGMADGVRFHGVTPHRRLAELLNQMDALLHPALEESFGVVLAEAMALGLPVVAGRDSGAAPWVLGADAADGGCAELTDVADSAAIAAALRRLFDDRYAERSARGFARARAMFAPEPIVSAYVDLYRDAMAGVR